MSPNQYQEACLKTENKDFESIKLRLRDPAMVEALFDTLHRVVHNAKGVDRLKKFNYYGKGMVVSEHDLNVVAMVPTSEQRDRASVELINDKNVQLLHAVLGLITESGELAEMLLNTIYEGKPHTQLDWAKEFGDCGWYQAIGCQAIERSLQGVMELNIEKLAKRYPNLFTEKDAQGHNSH